MSKCVKISELVVLHFIESAEELVNLRKEIQEIVDYLELDSPMGIF